MTRSNSSYKTRIWTVLLLTVLALPLTAQRKLDAKGGLESFLDTQWWIGIRFGINSSQPAADNTYSIISPINFEASELEKSYKRFNLIGAQAGLDITYSFKGISIGFQPVFRRIRYSYDHQRTWDLDTEPDAFQTSYEVEQQVDFIDLPLIGKYDIIKTGNIRPYVSAGIQYSLITGANKKIDITHTDNITSIAQSGGDINLSVSSQFQNYAAALGGIGASFDYGNIRALIDITYQYALTSLVDEEKLFDENQLTSLGDVQDDLNVHGISFSVGIVFPLRYIDNTFQSSR